MISSAPLILAGLMLASLAAWSARRLFQQRTCGSAQALVFFLVISFSIFLLRWPQIKWHHELNPDESQMLAQAMRFMAHPVPWRDVDTTTSGPLNSVLLCLPMSFGAPASWLASRLVLWTLNCLTLLLLYLTLRHFGTRSEIQFALIPTILFYAFATDTDFLHYSSESLSIFLLSACFYLLANEWFATKPATSRWLLLGIIAGAIPFAKLQAAPLGLFVILTGVALLVARYRAHRPQTLNWPPLLALFLGATVIPALILGVVVASGAFNDFWKSYLLASASYAGHEALELRAAQLGIALFTTLEFRSYVITVLAAVILLLAAFAKKIRPPKMIFWPLAVVAADCVLTVICLLIAGKAYYHYALLLIPPLTLLFGLAFLSGKTAFASPASPNLPVRLRNWLASFSIVLTSLFLYQAANYRLHAIKFRHELHRDGWPTASLVSQKALSIRQPGDTLSVWGWMPGYYVETGMMPATRDAIGHYLITESPYRDYFRQRYLADLKRQPPALFIDAIAGNTFQWTWFNPEGHESFPELATFIDENYTLWLSIHMTNEHSIGKPIRLYTLKQRMAEKHLSPAELFAPADRNYYFPQ